MIDKEINFCYKRCQMDILNKFMLNYVFGPHTFYDHHFLVNYQTTEVIKSSQLYLLN